MPHKQTIPLFLRDMPICPANRFKPRREEIRRRKVQEILQLWAGGKTYEECGRMYGMSGDEVRRVIKVHLGALWKVHNKWKMAEVRCCALARELRLLRLGKEAPEDQPIETLNPPDCWLVVLRGAGIDTVNQLRAVDAGTLLAIHYFPRGAVDWACMKLEKLGLSHRLQRPTRPRRSVMPLLGNVIG